MVVYDLQAVYIGQDQVRPAVAGPSVSLNWSVISLSTAGSTLTLQATVTPSDAPDTSVSWSSNDTSVATVSQTGTSGNISFAEVTCVSPGNAIITVTTNVGGNTDRCQVTDGAYDLSVATVDPTTYADTYYYKPAISSNGYHLLSPYISSSDHLPHLAEYIFNTAYVFDPATATIQNEQLSEITTTASSISLVSAVYNALGDKLYVCASDGTDSTIYQYTLSTYFDITTRSLSATKTFTGVNISAFRIVNHGNKLLAIWYTPTSGQSYTQSKLMSATFGTAWSVSTLGGLSEELQLNNISYSVNSLAISPDGLRLYTTIDASSNKTLYVQYSTAYPYDFSKAKDEYTGLISSWFGNTDGGKGFDVHPSNGDIYLSSATYGASGTTMLTLHT